MEVPIIRPADVQDIDEMLSLYIEFHEFHVRGMPDRLRQPEGYNDQELRNALQAILGRDDAQLFVAVIKGQLLGLIEVYVRQDEPHPLRVPHHYGFVQSLIVQAPFRKHGLGTQLVVAAQQWSKEQGATEMQLGVWEFAAGPLAFYEGLGYTTLERRLWLDLKAR